MDVEEDNVEDDVDEDDEDDEDEPLGQYPFQLKGDNLVPSEIEEVSDPVLNKMLNFQLRAYNAYQTYCEMRDNAESSAAQLVLAEADVRKRRAETADLELRYEAAKRTLAEAEAAFSNAEKQHRVLEKHATAYGDAHQDEILHVEKFH
jgi:hypothetical protein